MISRPSLWPDSTGSNVGSINGEVNLRHEFDVLVYGPNKDGKNGHGQLFLLRRARRDTKDQPVSCTCVNSLQGHHASPNCSYCLGEGFLWDEEWVMGYVNFLSSASGLGNKNIRFNPGIMHVETKVFYLRYDIDLKHGDKIVEVKLDRDGKVITPYVREAIYTPQTIYDARSDNGRIEFYEVYCREEDAARPNNQVA